MATGVMEVMEVTEAAAVAVKADEDPTATDKASEVETTPRYLVLRTRAHRPHKLVKFTNRFGVNVRARRNAVKRPQTWPHEATFSTIH